MTATVAGRLTSREKPAKNFVNILKLGEIAADPHLVQPGNPEGSKIFQQIINKEMPYDVNYEFDTTKPEVTQARVGGWLDRAIPQIGSMIGRLVRVEDTAARLAPPPPPGNRPPPLPPGIEDDGEDVDDAELFEDSKV